MSRNRLVAVAAALVLSAGAVYAQDPTPPPAQRPTVDQRLENQKDRIQSGVADDQLTKREAARAARHDRAIKAQEANGAGTAKLDRELNRNSRQIARERHNNRKPKA